MAVMSAASVVLKIRMHYIYVCKVSENGGKRMTLKHQHPFKLYWNPARHVIHMRCRRSVVQYWLDIWWLFEDRWSDIANSGLINLCRISGFPKSGNHACYSTVLYTPYIYETLLQCTPWWKYFCFPQVWEPCCSVPLCESISVYPGTEWNPALTYASVKICMYIFFYPMYGNPVAVNPRAEVFFSVSPRFWDPAAKNPLVKAFCLPKAWEPCSSIPLGGSISVYPIYESPAAVYP